MNVVQLRDAKAGLSALVVAAERGEASVITRHGKPAAMLVPFAVGERLLRDETGLFADVLMAIPGDFEIERDRAPLRAAEM